jgi:hypothetical protein
MNNLKGAVKILIHYFFMNLLTYLNNYNEIPIDYLNLILNNE